MGKKITKHEINLLGLFSHKNSISSTSSSGKLHKSVKRSKGRATQQKSRNQPVLGSSNTQTGHSDLQLLKNLSIDTPQLSSFNSKNRIFQSFQRASSIENKRKKDMPTHISQAINIGQKMTEKLKNRNRIIPNGGNRKSSRKKKRGDAEISRLQSANTTGGISFFGTDLSKSPFNSGTGLPNSKHGNLKSKKKDSKKVMRPV